MYATAALTFIKVAQPGPSLVRWLLWFGVIPTAWVAGRVLWALFRQRPRMLAADALDQTHQLKGRIANAVAFGDDAPPGTFREEAVRDAERFAPTLSPRLAAPLRLPVDLLLSALLGLTLFGIAQLEVRQTRIVPPELTTFTPFVLNSDDVDLLRDVTEELEREVQDEETKAGVRRFNQLVTDIAEQRLSRKQIFQRLEELERQFADGVELDAEALEEGLEGVARELNKSRLSKPTAQALEQKRLPDAEEALRKLAERLKERPAKVDKAELERLRKALEAASQGSSERLARIDAQRREMAEQRRRLLRKKEEVDPAERPDLDEQLARTERQLKRLDRQKQRAASAQRQLDELDRQLARAAQELMKELGEAAKNLESGAESLHRLQQKQLSREEKEALKKQLEELRQLLRQSKEGGKERQERLERFRQRAQGKNPDAKPGGKPKPGGVRLGVGQGRSIEVPVPGQSQGTNQQPTGAASGSGGDPDAKWGSGSDDSVRGDPSQLEGQVKDVAAAGIDSGEGAASSEVVFGAAERGFVGRGYQKVYTDYKTVAEEVLESDEIPPGYRFYVRRYFQLIRPRD